MPGRWGGARPRVADLYPLPWLLSAAVLLVGYLWDSGYGGQGDGALRPTLAIVRPADLMLALAAAVIGLSLLVWRVTVRWSSSASSQARRLPTLSAWLAPRALAIGLVVCAGTLVLGAWNALVLDPLAIAPGHSLEEIYFAVAHTQGPSSLAVDTLPVVVWILFLGCLAVVIAMLLRRSRPAWSFVLAALLGLAGVAIPFQFLAGAYLGMDIADTLLPGYGTISAFTLYFWIAGRVMLSAALVLLPLRPPTGTRRMAKPT